MLWPKIITAMVTPFAADGSLDQERAENLARWLVGTGSEALVIAGTTGESPTLSDTERAQLYSAARRGAGRVPILVGTGSNDTRHTIHLSQDAQSWGADGLLIVTPYYNKPPQAGLVRHFISVAQSVTLPIMLYNVPGRTGCHLEADTVLQISQQAPNVIAIKEASGRLETFEQLLYTCPHLTVYSGDDSLFFPALSMGAYGVVSVASHLVAQEMAQMTQYYLDGDTASARLWHYRLQPIFRGLFQWPNPIPVKWMLNAMNIPVGPVRSPLVYPQDTRSLQTLRHAVEAIWEARSTTAPMTVPPKGA